MQPICTYELRLVCERSLVSVRSSIYAKSAHKSAIATAIDVALANRMRLVLDWTGPEGMWGIMLGTVAEEGDFPLALSGKEGERRRAEPLPRSLPIGTPSPHAAIRPAFATWPYWKLQGSCIPSKLIE